MHQAGLGTMDASWTLLGVHVAQWTHAAAAPLLAAAAAAAAAAAHAGAAAACGARMWGLGRVAR